MLLILPVLNFIALLWLASRRFDGIRESSLAAAAWWTIELVLITELLSLPHKLAEPWLALAWLILTITLAAIGLLSRREVSLSRFVTLPASKLRALTASERWMIAAAGIICLLVGATALLSAPNGSDQLQYHLPRMVEWADRGSVGFFPTHYYVQLFAPPLAEWAMLHTYVLTDGDRFVGMIQWLAFIWSGFAVSLIARELGARMKSQILAAVLCVTLPQGILAASGAKNDWVLSFWLAAMAYFGLRFQKDRGWLNALNMGVALGAALLSKGTVYVFLPPILLVLLVVALRSNPRTALRALPLVAGVAVLMNAGQWARNYTLGGAIWGLPHPDVAGKEKYSVDRISLPGAASNVIRELAMHLGTPSGPLTDRETAAVRSLISHIGANPDDPALTNYSSFTIPHYVPEEYYAGNLLHLLLIVPSFTIVLLAWRRFGSLTALLCTGITIAFVAYCTLFKWEVWCARLHLPLFVLACALVAIVVQNRFRPLILPLSAVLLLSAVPPALCNKARPLLFSVRLSPFGRDAKSIVQTNRSELYFSEQPELRLPYLSAADAMRKSRCTDIGIDTSIQVYAHEYPLLVLGRNPDQKTRFRYVDVHNLSSQYRTGSDFARPCFVVCAGCGAHAEKLAEYTPALPHIETFGNLLLFSGK